jgi:serine/threonine protein kinase
VRSWWRGWMCDSEWGCALQSGIDRGFFRNKRSILEGTPNVAAILATASQIADGMAYLHERGIIHGDLAGGNVLLTSDETSPHGFCAKVGGRQEKAGGL